MPAWGFCILVQLPTWPWFVKQMFGEGSPTDPQQAAAKRKQLVFELNKNGQYLRLKEQLKAGVLRIVTEQYHKSGSMDRDEMQVS